MFILYGAAVLSAASSAMGAGLIDAEASRVKYSNCLTNFTITHLDQKTARGAFNKAAPDACPDERNAMIAAMKKDELAFGSSDTEATSFATEEANGVLSSFTEAYASYLSSNSRPMKAD